jgi:ABC-2 type transport system ATP-binding protein
MTPALEIHQLHKTYKNGFHALKGIDLEVKEGDFFALLGPNGAGKSTAIGIITSLINTSSGEARIFGKEISTDPSGAKRELGLVPQEFNFNQFEPVEEIVINQAGYYGISRSTAKTRSEYYLKKLGLWDKHRAEARELSGGMKRRLMIARAMVHEPKMLILDEPTAGVDIEIRRSMWEFLSEINAQGTTVILTTHYLEEAENLCRNIAILDQGEIVENSSMKALLGKLDSEVFILDLKHPLTKAPQIPGLNFTLIDEQTLEVEVKSKSNMNHIFCELQAQDMEVISLRNKSNRLEALFLRIINNSSNENPAAEAP